MGSVMTMASRSGIGGVALLVAAILVLVVSVGVIAASLTGYLLLRRDYAAPACAAEVTSSCWREQPGTIQRIFPCRDGVCRLTVAAVLQGRPFAGDIVLDARGARKLAAGDPVTVRLVHGDVMLLRTTGGKSLARWDNLERKRRTSAIILAILTPIAIATALGLVWIVKRARRRTRESKNRYWPASWPAYAFGSLLAIGTGNLLVLPFLHAARHREARDYAAAPTCGAALRDDCRFQADAAVEAIDCSYAPFCEVTFRFAGAFGPARAAANLRKTNANDLRAAGSHARVEVFRGAVIDVDVGGRSIGPIARPDDTVRHINHLILAAAVMAMIGAVGLARHRRRSSRGRPGRWR